jgi:hypothetical protein
MKNKQECLSCLEQTVIGISIRRLAPVNDMIQQERFYRKILLLSIVNKWNVFTTNFLDQQQRLAQKGRFSASF